MGFAEQPSAGVRRLILGTAQFGMPYGVTNRYGQVPVTDAREILASAFDAGISLIDTASCYGASEYVLGQCLAELPDMGIVTKTIAIPSAAIGSDDLERVHEGVARSMEQLQRTNLDGLLVHHGRDLLKPGGEALAELLLEFKSRGIARRVGVSAYDAEEIDNVLLLFKPDIVQLPLNIFDQRLIRSGHIQALRSAGIEIHARSAFLQGILLAMRAALPAHFQNFSNDFSRYHTFLNDNELSPLTACLGFMTQQSGVDRIIVGVTSRAEMEEIVAAFPKSALPAMSALACASLELVDPRMWPKAVELPK